MSVAQDLFCRDPSQAATMTHSTLEHEVHQAWHESHLRLTFVILSLPFAEHIHQLSQASCMCIHEEGDKHLFGSSRGRCNSKELTKNWPSLPKTWKQSYSSSTPSIHEPKYKAFWEFHDVYDLREKASVKIEHCYIFPWGCLILNNFAIGALVMLKLNALKILCIIHIGYWSRVYTRWHHIPF